MVLILLLAAVVLPFWMHSRVNALGARMRGIEELRDSSVLSSPALAAFEAREAGARNAELVEQLPPTPGSSWQIEAESESEPEPEPEVPSPTGEEAGPEPARARGFG